VFFSKFTIFILFPNDFNIFSVLSVEPSLTTIILSGGLVCLRQEVMHFSIDFSSLWAGMRTETVHDPLIRFLFFRGTTSFFLSFCVINTRMMQNTTKTIIRFRTLIQKERLIFHL